MLEILIGKLYKILDALNFHTLTQLGVVIVWVIICRMFGIGYRVSLSLTLALLFFSILATVFNANFSGILGEYTFLLLVISVIQILIEYSQNDAPDQHSRL